MRRLALLMVLSLVLAVTAFAVSAARAVPPAPVLVSPTDGETVNTHSPLLQWTGTDAESFKVIVKNSLGEKVLKINADPATVCTGSDCSLSPTLNGVDFLNDTFTWKVVAKSVDGKTSSPKQTFTVDFPGTPELISPENGVTLDAVVSFEWSVVAAADQYKVKVKNTTTGEKFNSDQLSAGTVCAETCVYTPEVSITTAGDYKWSVLASQVTFPDNVSKSEKRTFTIAPLR